MSDKIGPDKIRELLIIAEKHQVDHACSAHPYKYGEKLTQLVSDLGPQTILEIGTGMGYSSALMAFAQPDCEITTIEKDIAHVEAATVFLKQQGIINRINIIDGAAEAILPTLKLKYDVIFFDGYGIHYEFLAHYQRLLNEGGLLIVANNHLQTKTSDQFFAELNDIRTWKIVEQFGDTTVAKLAG